MAIYGTALLSVCLICGLIVGNFIGLAIGVEANVGGVGIAMLMLIVVCGRLQATGRMPVPTQSGILFWSSIYIPIVVAMAASQNVRAAITGGPAAVVAGVVTVAICFAMVPVIGRLGNADSPITSSIDDRRDAREETDEP